MADMPSFLSSGWDDFEKYFGINGKTTADITGMNAGQAKAATAGATLKNAGMLASVFGGISSAVGSYFQAKSTQTQLKSQASSFQFQSDMDAINASAAEHDAQAILEAGKSQIANYTMEAGQRKATATASMAGRGVQLGVGSARDVSASMDIVKDMDKLTINSNAVRSAWNERMQATNLKNRSLLDRTSAINANSSANSISPMGAGFNSLLGSATNFASQWDWRRKIQNMSAGGF
jgi:hypothetical protein